MANRQPTTAIGGIQPPPEEAYSDEYSYSESYSYSYSESNTGQLSHRLSSPSAARAAIPAAAATSPGNDSSYSAYSYYSYSEAAPAPAMPQPSMSTYSYSGYYDSEYGPAPAMPPLPPPPDQQANSAALTTALLTPKGAPPPPAPAPAPAAVLAQRSLTQGPPQRAPSQSKERSKSTGRKNQASVDQPLQPLPPGAAPAPAAVLPPPPPPGAQPANALAMCAAAAAAAAGRAPSCAPPILASSPAGAPSMAPSMAGAPAAGSRAESEMWPSLSVPASAAARAPSMAPSMGAEPLDLEARIAQAMSDLAYAEEREHELASEANDKAAAAHEATSHANATQAAAEEAGAVEAAATGAAVEASLMREMAAADAKLSDDPVEAAASEQAAATELAAAEDAAADAAIAKERAVDAAVAAAVVAHAAEEASSAAFLAASRAHSETILARKRLEQLQSEKQQSEIEDGVAREAAGMAAMGAPAAAGQLPALRFDENALSQLEGAGTLLPASQLPTAVAAIFASLKAVPDAEAALEAKLAETHERRLRAEEERDALLAEVEPLRALVPTLTADELELQLRHETTRRQQLDAELAVVKGRIAEIADRVARLKQPKYGGGVGKPVFKPAEMLFKAREAGVPYVPPSEAANVAAQMEITAAELAKRLAETQVVKGLEESLPLA